MTNDTAQNLRAYLLTSVPLKRFVSNRIHQSQVSPKYTRFDFIWFRQAGKTYEHTLDDSPGQAPKSIFYDVECCSRDIDKAADIADELRNLFPYRGTMGTVNVKGAFVNDQSEDYSPLNESASEGIYVQSLQIEVCP